MSLYDDLDIDKEEKGGVAGICYTYYFCSNLFELTYFVIWPKGQGSLELFQHWKSFSYKVLYAGIQM